MGASPPPVSRTVFLRPVKIRRERTQHKGGGFTVIEILAVVAVGAVLIALSAAVYGQAISKCTFLKEISAGKMLISAYQAHAAENDGRFLPGMDYTATQVWDDSQQKNLTGHTANRYPFRLAPYFQYDLNGAILQTANRKYIDSVAPPGHAMRDYYVSAFPRFGINYYFVGGCLAGSAANPNLLFPNDCVARVGGTDQSLLVFASGGTMDGNTQVGGYNILTPPNLYAANWSVQPWSKEKDPGIYGNVDGRYQGRAVCAFLDGSVALKTIDELLDMRLWNRNAAANDSPDYTVPY